MSQAIGPVAAAAIGASSGTGTSAIALHAQLARYEKQLSECVNCASSSTPEGKAQIEEITERITQIKATIDKTTDRRGAPAVDNSSDSPAPASAVAALQAVPKSSSTTTGIFVDVQA